MIPRRALAEVRSALRRQAATALLGPRQAGKTTLALQVAEERDAVYLDLQLPEDRRRLTDTAAFLEAHEDRLVILDEVHRAPEIFGQLRGVIDRGRRRGKGTGRFLVLGSASLALLRQSESLAGRLARVDLNPLDVLEVGGGAGRVRTLWLRGGLPPSFLAETDEDSVRWRREITLAYFHRDIPEFGWSIPPSTLDDLFTMLAHGQGGTVNASKLAANLSLTAPTVKRYLELLADLHLLRLLRPYRRNTGKRLVKAPKAYLRDSGFVHSQLGILDYHGVTGHPVVGASWEGFVIENLLSAVPFGTHASWYRTTGGAELDLILDLPGSAHPWAIEIKYGRAPRPSRGFWSALEDVAPEQAFVVHSGEDRYPLREGVEAIGITELAGMLAAR